MLIKYSKWILLMLLSMSHNHSIKKLGFFIFTSLQVENTLPVYK